MCPLMQVLHVCKWTWVNKNLKLAPWTRKAKHWNVPNTGNAAGLYADQHLITSFPAGRHLHDTLFITQVPALIIRLLCLELCVMFVTCKYILSWGFVSLVSREQRIDEFIWVIHACSLNIDVCNKKPFASTERNFSTKLPQVRADNNLNWSLYERNEVKKIQQYLWQTLSLSERRNKTYEGHWKE